MEIVWTKLAYVTYKEVFENLGKKWIKKEMIDFNNLTNHLLEKVKNEQIVYPYVNEKLGVRKGIIHKNVSLFYKEDRINNKIYYKNYFKKFK